jgi:hypothetical protein
MALAGAKMHRIVTAAGSVPANVERAAVTMASVSEELFADETLANLRDRVRPLRQHSRRPHKEGTVLRRLDRGVRGHPALHMRRPADNALLGGLVVRIGEGGGTREVSGVPLCTDVAKLVRR